MKLIRISIFLLLTSVAVYSQEVGIHAVKYWSNNYEFQNPVGYGISLYQKIWKLGMKFDYTYAENQRNYYGILVAGFFGPGTNPTIDNIVSRSYLNSFELAVVIPKIISIEDFYFNLGAGIYRDRFSGNRRGIQTNRSAILQGSTQYGFLFSFSFSKEKIFNLPVNLTISFTQKYSESSMHVLDAEAPFQDSMEIKKIQLCVSYIL